MLAQSYKSGLKVVPRVLRAPSSLASAARPNNATFTAQRAACLSTWDRVQSSLWHPMATTEQSLMEMDRIASQFFSRSLFPITRMLPRVREGEDDFFNDLTVKSSSETLDPKKASDSDASGRSYSSYSFSSSTVVDEEGRRVSTTRRRYEDSTGRLKALHEREIDGKKLKTVWQRKNADDQGEHHSVCVGANAEEFESQWKHTPFGQAEEEQQKKQVGEEQPAKSAFGIGYEAAKAAPDNNSKHGEGVTKEAQDRSREEAIAQAAKTQEEETTLPSYL